MKNRKYAEPIYLMLGAIFISALVTSNLIFQKFIGWNPFGWYNLELSVGILPYPITFIATDIISEIYGRKRANQIVLAGLVASVFSLCILMVSNATPATDWSPINDETFSQVFGLSFAAVAASMGAYLLAQFIDIRIFHFWKKKTKGKHLWLRNNASTSLSQLSDTAMVLFLLCSFGAIEWELFGVLLLNGYLFKVIIALLDTPIIYIGVYGLRKLFNLAPGEEISHGFQTQPHTLHDDGYSEPFHGQE